MSAPHGEARRWRRRLGPTLGVAVLLFGGKKIPEVAKGLGEGIRNFKTALKGDDEKPETPAKPADPSKTEKA